jgi:Ca-activated chloride channel family protein
MKGRALKFANFEAIARVKGIDLFSKNIFLLIFNILFISLLVLSVSGLTLHRQAEVSSFSFVIAIDSSQSMSATDLIPDRITVAREIALDFVKSLEYESNIGVVSFSGDSYIEQALTTNKQEVEYVINNMQLSNVGGTDIYEAVLTSSELLETEDNKAIILLSDGQINIGNIGETVDYARFNNVLVHTIGIGTVTGGETSYGISKLDEDSLKSLAYNTDGKYFNVNNENKIEDPLNEIIKPTRKLSSTNLGFYLIIGAIVLFIIKQFLLSINKIMW